MQAVVDDAILNSSAVPAVQEDTGAKESASHHRTQAEWYVKVAIDGSDPLARGSCHCGGCLWGGNCQLPESLSLREGCLHPRVSILQPG